MAPNISVCRKGDEILLTVKGGFTDQSFQELLVIVRQLLMTSLKCAAPGSPVTYSFSTRGKVDLEKMGQIQDAIQEPSVLLKACTHLPAGQRHGDEDQPEKSSQPQPRHGLILVKGGAR